MKKLKISLLVLGLLISANSAAGQTANINFHFTLEPNQKRESIQIETSCLILLRDYSITMSIPFGKSYVMILPKDTSYLVEKGTYQLENPMNSILEFELLSPDKCKSKN